MSKATPINPKGGMPKPAASPFDESLLSAPASAPVASILEMPAALREAAQRSDAQARHTFEQAKAATGETTEALQHTYTAAAKSTVDYNLKIIEIARTNTNAAFEYAQELLQVKSMSEFIALSTARARKQFDTMSGQSKELAGLAQKLTSDIAAPLQAGVTKTFNKNA